MKFVAMPLIDCGYLLELPHQDGSSLTCTHNLCFEQKANIRKEQKLSFFTVKKLQCNAFFFTSVLRTFQDYFSSYEMGQSVGGRKRDNPPEKPSDTPASRTWLVSHGQCGA